VWGGWWWTFAINFARTNRHDQFESAKGDSWNLYTGFLVLNKCHFLRRFGRMERRKGNVWFGVDLAFCGWAIHFRAHLQWRWGSQLGSSCVDGPDPSQKVVL